MLLAAPIAGAESVARGAVLVIAAASEGEPGGLLLVDRDDGTRRLVSDFADPRQGPLVARAADVAVTPDGRVLVADFGVDGLAGALVEIARDGSRRLVSDFADPRQGATGAPGRLAATRDGTIIVVMRVAEYRHEVLVAVDRRGRRSLLSDFQDEAQGPALIPADVTVRADGSIVVLAHVTGGDSPLVEVTPDGRRHVLSQLSDGRQPSVELPTTLAESSTGTLLILEEYGRPPGSVIEVAPDDVRTIFRDLSDPRFGPITESPADLGVEADDTLLVLDRDAGTPRVLADGGTLFGAGALLAVAADGTRVVLSDFGDPSQGEAYRIVQRLALLADRDSCRGRRLARSRGVGEHVPRRGIRTRGAWVGGGWCTSAAGGPVGVATRR